MSAAYAALAVGVVAALWMIGAWVLRLPGYILPDPVDVGRTLVEDRRTLAVDTLVTGREAALGFLTAAVVGVGLGMTIAFQRRVGGVLYPILIGSNSLPKVAVAPLFVVWMGFGLQPKVAIAFLVAFFPVVINTIAGLRGIPDDMVELVRSMTGSSWRILWRVRLPYALPTIVAGYKVAVSLAVVGAVVGEFVAADRGLGYRIVVATGAFDTTVVFASLVLLTALALALFGVVSLLGWLLTPGRGESELPTVMSTT